MKRPLITLALIIVTTLAIIAYRDSQIPRATATLQVHPSMIAINIESNSNGRQMTRHYMESEYQTIPSKETLALAATLLGIEENQQAEAIQLMDKNVTTAPIRGSDFITITAKYPDPQQAINTADAIAEAYVQRRTETEVSHANRALEALDEEILSQQEKVTAHQTDFQAFIDINGQPPFNGDDPVELSLKHHQYTQAKETHEQANAMLREMKIKQQEARILLKMPRQPITIHERATLTPSPAPTEAN